MIGLPVIVAPSGERVGRVLDVLVHGPENRVLGLLLEGNIAGARPVVPYEEIQSVGGSAVMLRRNVVLTARQRKKLDKLLASHAQAVGRRLLSEDGQDLGVIDDLVFDSETARVLGYRVSSGLLQDLLLGQGFLPVDHALTWGLDVVIVKREALSRR